MKASKAALKIALVAGVCLALAEPAKAVIAYQNPTGTYGNSTGGGTYNVGMDFTVGGQGITVTRLGAFDNGQNGFTAPVTVAIYRVSDQTIVGNSTTVFSGTSGNLSGGSRFIDVTDFILGVGTYRIVAGGYGGDTSGRERLFLEPDSNVAIATDTGGGVVSFGGNYYGSWTAGVAFPTTAGPSTVPGYAAGTFDFTPVPEASQFAVAGVGLLGLVYVGRCAWQRRKQA